MKIYEIGTGYTPIPAKMGAATEIVVEALTKAMLRQGADVEIIDIASGSRPDTVLPIREVKVPRCFSGTDVALGILHKLKRVVYSVALAGHLRKLLKQAQEPVVLHFHNQYNLFFFLKLVNSRLRNKAAILYTVHSYIWPAPWERIRNTVKKKYFQEVFCVRHADGVLVLNTQTREHFIDRLRVDPDRIHLIANGVDTEVYRPLEPWQTAAFRQTLGLEGKRLLLQVGSVCDRKDQLGAVKDLSGFLKKNPDTVYLYAGGIIDQDYQGAIEGYAREEKIASQVVYTGELEPGAVLNGYYNAADALLFPSKQESFGLVILEALSAGTPVLLKEKPIFPLQEGYRVYADPQDLTRQMEALRSNPGSRASVRRETAARYSWNAVAGDHLRIMETIQTGR